MQAVRSQASHSSPAHRERVEDVIAALGSDSRRGLSEDAARSRLERSGANEVAGEKPVPAWRRFVRQFQNVLVILLLVATAISAGLWAFERDAAWPYEATAILAVVLLNAALGFIQEARAEAAIAALRAMSAAHATVIRGGERRSISAAGIVPGDIVLIEEGSTIAADAPLIESIALQTSEASLTGESLPVTRAFLLLYQFPGEALSETDVPEPDLVERPAASGSCIAPHRPRHGDLECHGADNRLLRVL